MLLNSIPGFAFHVLNIASLPNSELIILTWAVATCKSFCHTQHLHRLLHMIIAINQTRNWPGKHTVEEEAAWDRIFLFI
jgi:hypothetical protein